MREIKFRAWDKKTKKWVDDFDVSPDGNAYFHHGADDDRDPDLLNVELMQYTGLKDKNGVEIYEGDILESEGNDWLRVYWHRGFAGFYLESSNAGALNLDEKYAEKTWTIGNTYETPELLK